MSSKPVFGANCGSCKPKRGECPGLGKCKCNACIEAGYNKSRSQSELDDIQSRNLVASYVDKISKEKGSTAIDPDDKIYLIDKSIVTLKDADEVVAERAGHILVDFELKNRKLELSEYCLKDLHGEIFGSVWSWGGQFRNTETNIGVPPEQVRVQIREAFKNLNTWIETRAYPIREIAIRLHCAIINIHPFKDGNGRVGRMFADLLLLDNGEPPIEFIKEEMNFGDFRSKYIEAMRESSRHNFGPIMKLMR